MLQHQVCSLMLWVVVTPGVLGQQPWLPVPIPGTCRALPSLGSKHFHSAWSQIVSNEGQIRIRLNLLLAFSLPFLFCPGILSTVVPLAPGRGSRRMEKPLPPIPAAELTTSLPTNASSARFPCHLLC